jgi:hypothetical protein
MERDPEFAACNLFNDPSRSEIRAFQDEWLRYWRYTDGDGRILMYEDEKQQKQFLSTRSLHKVVAVDPAASSGGAEGARNAIVVLGTDQESGKHFVLETVAHRSDPKDLITDVVDVAQRWGVSVVHIELAGQQAYIIQWVEKESRARGYPLAVEPLKPGGRNKDLRIGGLVVPFKNGDIYVQRRRSGAQADWCACRLGQRALPQAARCLPPTHRSKSLMPLRRQDPEKPVTPKHKVVPGRGPSSQAISRAEKTILRRQAEQEATTRRTSTTPRSNIGGRITEFFRPVIRANDRLRRLGVDPDEARDRRRRARRGKR